MNALIARACSAWLCLVTFIVTVTGGCVDSPLPDALPLARVIVAWDVRRCDVDAPIARFVVATPG